MMIAIIQEKGRHAENDEFREALCLSRALHRIGINTLVWGLGYHNFNLSFKDISRACNAIIILENYDSGWLPDLSEDKRLKIFWSIDSHCNLENHLKLCAHQKVDIVLNAVYGHGEKHFSQYKHYWVPNAYPKDLIQPAFDEDYAGRHDVGFCGNLNPEREIYINAIKRSVESFRENIFALGRRMVLAVSSYKIHFNRNIADDINFRTFETLGCGTVLFTNHTPGIELLFDTEEQLVIYNDIDDMISKMCEVLNNEGLRRKIAKAGLEQVRNYHTYDNRARKIIDIIYAN